MNRRKLRFALLAGAACAVLVLPGGSLYYEYSAGASCARCHEIRKNYDVWHASSHRGVKCGACHGEITTLDPGFHLNNLRRVVQHVRGGFGDPIRLRGEDVPEMTARCRTCHQQEFAQWQSGAHSTTYQRIFLDNKHNGRRALIDDCLRCHGMHFEGGIRDLVAPLDTRGPWRLLRQEMANEPAIPCLACHQMHRQGELMGKASPPPQPGAGTGAVPSVAGPLRPAGAGAFLRLYLLSLPSMREGATPVKISPDARQALCYQCHAPLATAQVGSGDDRTPLGVHAGLSCIACHQNHSQQTRASCATCHPRLSNCGLDVEKMDTTFATTSSKHNIHFVKCADCHRNGVPRRRDRASPSFSWPRR